MMFPVVSSLDAHLILLSAAASLLAGVGVGATPVPLTVSTDTDASTVAKELRPWSLQVRAPQAAPREHINFHYVRDTHATDPSHVFAVDLGRSLSEDTGLHGLMSRSFDSLTASDSNIPMTRRDNYHGFPIFSLGKVKGTRPSLEAVGNPIHRLLVTELKKEQYHCDNPTLAVRMLRLDLMFALTEEHDFNDWHVAWLKQRLENDRLVFLQNIEQPLARDCLVRIQYFQAVLDHKHNIIDTKPAPPQLPPGDVVPKDNRYTTFLRNEIKNILHDGTARSRLTLAQRITELGLQYNLLRELGFPKKETRNLVNLKDFEVEDGSSEAAREQCVARAKYYLDLLPEVSSR